MPIRITGLRELRKALRDADDATPREITAALRDGAKQITARARELAPKKTGRMAGTARPFANQRAAGVRFNHPGAGVQEFATDYLRHNKGSGGSGVSNGARKYRAATGSAPGRTNEVHLVNVNGSPPRFAYRAVNELGPKLIESTFDQLVDILRCHGWFDG